MTNEELNIAYRMFLQSKGYGIIGNLDAKSVYFQSKLQNFLVSPDNNTGIKTLDQVRTLCRFTTTTLEGSTPKDAKYLSVIFNNLPFWNDYTLWMKQQKYFGQYVDINQNGLFTGEDGTLYDGHMFSNNGGHALLYHFSTLPATETSQVLSEGTPIFYGGSFVANIPETGYTTTPYDSVTGNHFTVYAGNTSFTSSGSYSGKGVGINGLKYSDLIYYSDNNTSASIWGYVCLGYTSTPGNMYNVKYYDRSGFSNQDANHWGYSRLGSQIDKPSGSTVNNVSIGFEINNNFNGDITNYPDINADGKLYITPKIKIENKYYPIKVDDDDDISPKAKDWDDEEPEDKQAIPDDKPPTPSSPEPDVGGGDSTDGGNYGPENPEDGTITLPDVDFELPDIDWSIKGLKDKFPFSIPFDLMAMFQVLNAEPQTPEIDATIDLKVVSWHIDYDLHQFDGVAQICRNLEFIAFCVSLILITRSLIKG